MSKKKVWWLALVGLVALGVVLFFNLGVGAVVGNFITNLSQSSLGQNVQPQQSRSILSPDPLPTPELRYQVHNLPQAVVHSLEIPQNYQVKTAVANELQTLPRFAANQRLTALLNGGFFDPQNQLSTSFVTSQGQLVADPRQNPRLMNNPQLVTYLDKILDRSELRLYNCEQASGQASEQNKRYAITNHNQPIPADCQLTEAIGGGPQLLPELTATAEGFLATENGVVVRDAIGLSQPNARTAVGIKANGDLVWVMVAQKTENPRSSGLSLPDLAKFMTQLGVIQALNLDGGSSSSFYYQGQTFYGKVNAEGDRVQRAVKSVLTLQ
jgi:hypothetical protein